MIASDNGGGGTFEQAPVGAHPARCIKLIDIGTHHGEYEGVPNVRHQIIVGWELPGELIQTGDYAGQPFTVSEFYTLSLGEKSKLRPMLESWRGNAEIRLESKDFKAMATLISRLQETLQLKRVDFSVSPALRRSTEESMTAEAIAAFRSRADAIRSAWGAKGYRLVQMDLGTAGAPPPYVPVMRAMKAAGAEAAPAQDFSGGETSLVVSVNGTVELQP